MLSPSLCFKEEVKSLEKPCFRIAKNRVEFVFGQFDMDLETPHVIRRKASRIFTNPKYNGKNSDLAIVEFDKKVKFTDFIRPTCLNLEPIPKSDMKMCRVCGYGVSKGDF